MSDAPGILPDTESQQGHILDAPRLKMLENKLGSLLHWSIPQLQNWVGPYDPSVFSTFDVKRRIVIDACVAELNSYTPTHVTSMLDSSSEEGTALNKVWSNHQSDEIFKLTRYAPPWFAGGFGHPDYAADFEYWSKMTQFSLNELTCVSVGVDPDFFSDSKLLELQKVNSAIQWPSAKFLLMRREQLARQFDPRRAGWGVSPRDFLKWAERVEFVTHPEFLRLLTKYHDDEAQHKTSAVTAVRADKREIDTIAQLFTVMAIDQLGYKPNQARSPIPNEISDLAAKLGITVSDDTVRKYLKLGASFLPPDWDK